MSNLRKTILLPMAAIFSSQAAGATCSPHALFAQKPSAGSETAYSIVRKGTVLTIVAIYHRKPLVNAEAHLFENARSVTGYLNALTPTSVIAQSVRPSHARQ